jgi:hypothetical protein
VLYLTNCPLCSHGAVRPLVTRSGQVILMCDEDGAVWLRPGDVSAERFVNPSKPDLAFDHDPALGHDSWHWARWDDIDRLTDWDPDSFRQVS